jgi:predicted ATPase
MIESIHIKNFKSVIDQNLEIGTFNVLIGENGCGKSNILEAIAFGAAGSANKLEYEYFANRGIRATNPEFMFPAFPNYKKRKSITIKFQTSDKEHTYEYDIINDPDDPKKWIDQNKRELLKEIEKIFTTFYLEDDETKKNEYIAELEDKESINRLTELIRPFHKDEDYKEFFSQVFPKVLEQKMFSHPHISEYVIYSPEQAILRNLEETKQIYPLGIKGEGLFQWLKELAFKKKLKTLNAIKKDLMLLDWYEDFVLPKNLLKNELSLEIKDKYLDEKLQYFDQRSANEGFLFLLFYFTLFISKDTPKFFAIDNIDSSLNPKLCMQLTKSLALLAKKNGKQVIVTTQNPAILDGLNLADKNQRLFVISRNEKGYTRAQRIQDKDNRTMRLSEVWTKGFIGGLPDNF